MVLELLASPAMPGKHHFGGSRTPELCLVVGVLIGVGFVGGDYFFGQLVGDVVVVGKFHGVGSASLRLGDEVVGVGEHFREGDLGLDHYVVASKITAGDASATRA